MTYHIKIFVIFDSKKPYKLYLGTTNKKLEDRLQQLKRDDSLLLTSYFNKNGWNRAKCVMKGTINTDSGEEVKTRLKELYHEFKPTLQGKIQPSVFA